jgi:hypothetical protein
MEEFEKLESELGLLWDEYVVKHRILAAMEQAKFQVEQAEERRYHEQMVCPILKYYKFAFPFNYTTLLQGSGKETFGIFKARGDEILGQYLDG